MSTLRAALVQLNGGGDAGANTEAALRLIREAASEGAAYVQTPEVTNMIPPSGAVLMERVRDEGEDETLAALRSLAAELGLWLHVGSLALRSEDDPERAANRAFLIGPDGAIRAHYDKIHMFEADLGER